MVGPLEEQVIVNERSLETSKNGHDVLYMNLIRACRHAHTHTCMAGLSNSVAKLLKKSKEHSSKYEAARAVQDKIAVEKAKADKL